MPAGRASVVTVAGSSSVGIDAVDARARRSVSGSSPATRAEWYGPVVVTDRVTYGRGDARVGIGAERDDDLVGSDREQLRVVDHDQRLRGERRAMTIERIDPILQGDERTMLRGWLDYHRATLAMKCEGLTDDRLRLRAVEPSTMSLLGLVRHMGEVERNWFRRVMGGSLARTRHPGSTTTRTSTATSTTSTRPTSPRRSPTGERNAQHARTVEASFESLDDVRAGPAGAATSRCAGCSIHMIEEYARHNGHADLLRERIDGTTGD